MNEMEKNDTAESEQQDIVVDPNMMKPKKQTTAQRLDELMKAMLDTSKVMLGFQQRLDQMNEYFVTIGKLMNQKMLGFQKQYDIMNMRLNEVRLVLGEIKTIIAEMSFKPASITPLEPDKSAQQLGIPTARYTEEDIDPLGFLDTEDRKLVKIATINGRIRIQAVKYMKTGWQELNSKMQDAGYKWISAGKDSGWEHQ